MWKGEAEKRASADRNAIVGSSWEKKMRDKALKQAFKEQKAAVLEAVREKRKVGARLPARQQHACIRDAAVRSHRACRR